MFSPKEIAQRLSGELKIIIDETGIKRWYLNGKLHRENGPAIEYAYGSKEWWLNGKLHREDGPAIELIAGYKVWWFNGMFIKREFCDPSKRNSTEIVGCFDSYNR